MIKVSGYENEMTECIVEGSGSEILNDFTNIVQAIKNNVRHFASEKNKEEEMLPDECEPFDVTAAFSDHMKMQLHGIVDIMFDNDVETEPEKVKSELDHMQWHSLGKMFADIDCGKYALKKEDAENDSTEEPKEDTENDSMKGEN